MKCDFCSLPLKIDYHPINSKRGAAVSVCDNCGLFQTEYLNKEYKSQPPGSMSCDADRSSFRYTKSLVKNKYSSYINGSNLGEAKEIIDIGSNRGAFISFIEENFNDVKNITAIEPHEESTLTYKDKKNITLKLGRIEYINLKKDFFDFAYCVHTLEHVWSAKKVLLKIFNCLRFGGNFLLSVPKFEPYEDVVEELFIDPHTFHFTEELLKDFILKIGFEIISYSENNDAEIIFLLKKGNKKNNIEDYEPSINLKNFSARDLLIEYSRNLKNNRKNLKVMSLRIGDISKHEKVILWGSGRIFDALITIGELKPSENIIVCDTYLSMYVKELRGFKIISPKNINKIDKKAPVFILSRSYASEIKKEALALGYYKVKTFSEIL